VTDGKVNPFETLGTAMVALHTPDCTGTYNRNMTLNETRLSGSAAPVGGPPGVMPQWHHPGPPLRP